ncbi:LysR substrate-binding domain-containing protein [Melaminivora jejuensis]|uniref:LysR substrate-binding domain-containing protein n=1 Tax=Melaminivora jejuensis TaxID=1267217 RepID=UPI00398B8520
MCAWWTAPWKASCAGVLGRGGHRPGAGAPDQFRHPGRAAVPPALHGGLPPGHPLARRRRLLWSDLSGQPMITLQGQFTELLVSDVGEAARDLNKEAFTQVTFMTTALALVRAGLGLTLCMPYARTLVEQYGLVMRPVGEPVVERSFWIFTRRARSLSPAAQGFLEFLQQRLQGSGRPA